MGKQLYDESVDDVYEEGHEENFFGVPDMTLEERRGIYRMAAMQAAYDLGY